LQADHTGMAGRFPEAMEFRSTRRCITGSRRL
jgi:hypothetical protein